MIVYRKQEREADTVACYSHIREMVRQWMRSGFDEHGKAVELLTQWGEFECGVADALHPRFDSCSPVSEAFRKAGLLVGHVFFNSWENRPERNGHWLNGLWNALRSLGASIRCLPPKLRVRIPEGYACYGLYPETFIESAKRFSRDAAPRKVVAIGLRSIGVSLSLVVSAALEEFGCPDVVSYTLRPVGHPFDRRPRISPRLESTLLSFAADSYFLVIDEGPGLSGSSLCGTAQKLSELGIRDDRIVLFPGWEPEGRRFVSESARERWQKHRKYSSSFEDVWLGSGRLRSSLSAGELIDVSAGKWRSIFFDGNTGPAVHPWHERRKYLFSNTPELPGHSPPPFRLPHLNWAAPAKMARFVGLAHYGKGRFERAVHLSEASFSQPVSDVVDGFIIADFVPGRPLSKGEGGESLVEAVARYLVFTQHEFPANSHTAFDDNLEMMRRNVSLGLGEKWIGALRGLEKFRPMVAELPGCAIDGRMLPHEWLATSDGFLKVDAVDHHSDQFFPQCQNIAWDVASACIEFGWAPCLKRRMVERYRAASGDAHIADRLPFYSIAYAAYRLGYCVFAAEDLASTADGPKFRRLARFYASHLKRLLRLI